MYRLTDIMLQSLEKDLRKFHELFQGGRCQAWQLEEVIAKAINSDFNVKDKAFWKGNGHDMEADITVGNHKLSIKSGTIKNEVLVLSGHRLGRFNGDLPAITEFLNKNRYFFIAVPYELSQNELGKSHNYQIFYIDILKMQINPNTWIQKGKSYSNQNDNGIKFKIQPSMSWQIWWEIPISTIPISDKSRVISIT